MARFVTENALSLRLVDSPAFRALVQYLNRDCDPPDRHRLRDRLIPDLDLRLRTAIRSRLDTVKSFSISFDGWTSLAVCSWR